MPGPFFRYTKQEKRGIFLLLILIGLLQYGMYRTSIPGENSTQGIFEVDSMAQAFVDSVILAERAEPGDQPRPFNPNFLSDYRGYLLGLTPGELDRLYDFRNEGRFVNSPEEFQSVTGISDSLLTQIRPYFKFPRFREIDWPVFKQSKGITEFRDLNEAGEVELQTIRGIGPVLSSRIVRFRERLGGFLVSEQLFDVYGLDPEVARRAMQVFRVKRVPQVEKIALNDASAEELSRLIYLDRELAKRIVNYRNTHGRFDSIEQLTKIEDFPADRIGRIKLYLAL